MSQVDDLIGKTVLVTGASGFLGSRTVALLSEHGCLVHALVRKSSRTSHLELPNVTKFHGDITYSESLFPAFENVDYVIHAAADTDGTEEGGQRVTIDGTRNILDLCASSNVKKLVYISSCNVYGVAAYEAGRLVNESAPLEQTPEQRGAYSWAKLDAEKLVTRFMAKKKTPVVCLRPGTIYGPGGQVYSPMMGFSLGNRIFAVIDNGDFILPLVYIDNLVATIIASLTSEKCNGQIYNVVDPDRVDKKRYINRLISRLYPRANIVYFPYRLLHFLVQVQEKLCAAIKREPFLTCYRLNSSQNPIMYDIEKLVKHLNYRQIVSFEEAVANMIEYERNKLT